MLKAKPQKERPVCQEHSVQIKLVCIDTECSTSPLVCSICLGQKKDYHKTNKGIIHSLRELNPLLDKICEIQKASGNISSQIETLAQQYFESLKENMNLTIDQAHKDVLQKIRSSITPSSLSKAEAQVMDHLRNGAFDQILPKSLSQGADKIMDCEIGDSFIELDSIRKILQSLLQKKFIENSLKQIKSQDILHKLFLISNILKKEFNVLNGSPLPQYRNIMAKYYRLQGPLDWKNCGTCNFAVALFKEEMLGDQKMYRDVAAHQNRSIIVVDHPGNGGCFNSEALATQTIHKSARILTTQIQEKFGLKDIWKDILVIHGKPQGWAHNAEEGSVNAFGGPAGKGFSFCRGGQKIKKRIHLFVFS